MKKLDLDKTTKLKERGVQVYLKDLAENSFDIQSNYTPAEICEMMLEKVDLVNAKSILVLYNLELLFALKKKKYKGVVTFFTQSEKKASIASKILPNTIVEYIDKEENPLYFMETKWPEKFDIVIANPPYSGKLDLKFLDKAFDIAKEEVVFVHPSPIWVSKRENSFFTKKRDSISKNLKSLTLLNGNGLFGIGLYTPISITHLVKEHKGLIYYKNYITGEDKTITENEIENLSIFGMNKSFNSVYKKLYLNKSIEKSSQKGFYYTSGGNNHQKYLRNENAYIVDFTHIKGHTVQGENVDKTDFLYKHDYFVYCKKNTIVKHRCNPNYLIWFEFQTKKEAENFLSYIKTDFARFCLALVKRDQVIKLTSLPWMDFTQEWTDDKLYVHFGITEEEQTFIKEVIPPYYD